MLGSNRPGIATLVWRSLSFFRSMHIALAGGVAAATAVIVGALAVGDSVRGSLRALVIDRLGNIECGMFSLTYFDGKILGDLEAIAEQHNCRVEPTISLPSISVERRSESALVRAGRVQAFGVSKSFFRLAASSDSRSRTTELAPDEVAINASLARELNAVIGDEISVRLPKQATVSAESPLGKRDDSSVGLPRQKIVAILPDAGVGGLNLRTNQTVPKNIFLAIESLQSALDIDDRVNGALVLSDGPSRPNDLVQATRLCDQFNSKLVPSLEDYGLELQRHRRVFPDTSIGEIAADGSSQVVYDYFQISTKQLVLDDATGKALMERLRDRGVYGLAYLANSISLIAPDSSQPSVEVPYSIVMGIEESGSFNFNNHTAVRPLEMRSRVCWINSWLAEQLKAEPGMAVRLHYFQPETVDGREIETSIDLQILGIVPLVEPEERYERNRPAVFGVSPTQFNDPNLTPRVPGVSDQDSIAKFDFPFKLQLAKIRPADDEYYERHRLTPKIFVPYATADRFFGARFGHATSIRVDAKNVTDEAELRSLATDAMLQAKLSFGMQFLPIRQQQLEAATGTTPFDGLFLALSFFVIASALLLVALLFRLGVQHRTSQWGLLLAQGFNHRRVRALLLCEALAAASLGTAIGIPLGLGYARLMIAGLQSWWLGAISVPFLQFAYTPTSLLIGATIGLMASLLAIYLCLWRLERKQSLDLLRGRWDADALNSRTIGKLSLSIAGICLIAVIGLTIFGAGQSGMVRAGTFFGCGMLLLSASLIGLRQWLSMAAFRDRAVSTGGLARIAGLAICRNPLRSVLTLGLLAVASFLIASMSVFQVSPSSQGYGGFDLMAESSLPIHHNIGSGAVRSEVLGPADEILKKTTIVAMRSRPGDDASCTNLFNVNQPTVVAIPAAFDRQQAAMPSSQAFQWAARRSSEELPWQDLAIPSNGSEASPIPVVIDQNTAAWSLKQGGSIGAVSKFEFDNQVLYFRTVGLLSNSVLQGKLLIGETNFKLIFPKISGYRSYLINTHGADRQQVTEALENGWSDEGFDVVSSRDVLDRLLAVQNTYISAFQSLGALGLLLGTFGLAVVQMRSVLERRRELALMRAVGFSGSRIAQLLLTETLLLLAGGIAIGVLAAAVAIVPYILEVGQQATAIRPLMMLAAVFAVGTLAATYAIRSAVKQPILSGLRTE